MGQTGLTFDLHSPFLHPTVESSQSVFSRQEAEVTSHVFTDEHLDTQHDTGSQCMNPVLSINS